MQQPARQGAREKGREERPRSRKSGQKQELNKFRRLLNKRAREVVEDFIAYNRGVVQLSSTPTGRATTDRGEGKAGVVVH